jgi:hypothetical protein
MVSTTFAVSVFVLVFLCLLLWIQHHHSFDSFYSLAIVVEAPFTMIESLLERKLIHWNDRSNALSLVTQHSLLLFLVFSIP